MIDLAKKRADLPKVPGVYLYKNKQDKIIYVGKAAVLKNRVGQYFQKSRPLDPKTTALVADIADLEYIEVESEIDALFLEAELVRRYQPKYNILLRDDKSPCFIRIDINSDHPTVTVTRRPLDDKAQYFGPFFNARLIRSALKQLRKAFPYSTHTNHVPARVCLLYQLGLCPGLEENKTSLNDYRRNLRMLINYIKGSRNSIVKDLEKEMKVASKNQEFEKASLIRNRLYALKGLRSTVLFGRDEFMDISSDRALRNLQTMLGLNKSLKRIEGYDISHMSGTDNVASMVVFVNGLPDKSSYRKFKMRLKGNDDFGHMREVITRRLSPTNIKSWGLPDLILIDGGKGQLSSAVSARDALDNKIPMIGLAKREEEIIIKNEEFPDLTVTNNVIKKSSDDFSSLLLGTNDDVVKLLQRIRDESHRFAVSYHSSLKRARQNTSPLDEIEGLGPITKKKLIRTFGSTKGVLSADINELRKTVGPKLADKIVASHENGSTK